MHSLAAVCLHACGRGSEVGALFGALGVLSAIGHIVSVSPFILMHIWLSSYTRQFSSHPFMLLRMHRLLHITQKRFSLLALASCTLLCSS